MGGDVDVLFVDEILPRSLAAILVGGHPRHDGVRLQRFGQDFGLGALAVCAAGSQQKCQKANYKTNYKTNRRHRQRPDLLVGPENDAIGTPTSTDWIAGGAYSTVTDLARFLG